MTEENQEAKKPGRKPAKVKCEVIRKIFIAGPDGSSVPVAPNELTSAQLKENAERKKAKLGPVKPEKKFIDLDRDLAAHFQEAGGVKVAL